MKRIALLLCAALLCSLALSACGGKPAPEAPKDATGRYLLAENGEAVLNDPGLASSFQAEDNARVFYEIFVGSFSDSDGDGTGDLRGIIDRMDYLNDGDPASGLSLGVEGIWLTPVFQSPSYHKYDVADYYTVDPAFGTLDDLKELAELCHQRNVKLILDLPINHTGARNHWYGQFVLAQRQGNTADPYYDFYSYRTAEEGPASGFAPLSGTDIYYECNFSGDMPELNYDNEAVRQAVLDVAKFYLDLGVDGFRFDAAKYIYYGDNARSAEFWRWYVGELRRMKPDVYTVAEVWDNDAVTDAYFPAVNCFDFTTSQSGGAIASAAKTGNVGQLTGYLSRYIASIRSARTDAMPVLFIANHDTDRAAGFLPVSLGEMQMAANLYLLSPGSPFIYYGEELGMKGSRGSANTDANRRLAMLWGDGDTVKNPTGASYDQSKQVQSDAVTQMADGDSLYSYYKRLIMIRKANPAIARGEYKPVSLPGTKAGGFTSTLEGVTVCVLHNPTDSDLTVDLSALQGGAFTELRAWAGLGQAALEGSTLTLPARTSAVLG